MMPGFADPVVQSAYSELFTALFMVTPVSLVIALFVWLGSGSGKGSGSETGSETGSEMGQQRAPSHLFVKMAGVAMGFGLFAYATGLLAGLSTVSVVGQLLPAAMGLIGGVAAYLFNKEGSNTRDVGVAIASFSASLMLGFLVGEQTRVEALRTQNNLAFELRFNEQRRANAAISEQRINQFRANLGLLPLDLRAEGER